MRDVVIVGAGELGGTLAHILARGDLASSIRLIDDAGQVAAGKALDIMQAAPIERFTTAVTGYRDLAMMTGGDITILADRVSGGEWQGDDVALLLKRFRSTAEHRVVIAAGASHREIVERGVRDVGFGRTRLFGSAPEALAGAVRALIALEADGSARDVSVTVLGVPPDQVVIPWDDATIAGLPATNALNESTRRRIAARVAALWPPGPIALATAAAKAVAGVLGGSRQLACAFVAPDDSLGRRARTCALPVRLNRSGIDRIELPVLSARDRTALDTAARIAD
jgi:malate dehydrogenase